MRAGRAPPLRCWHYPAPRRFPVASRSSRPSSPGGEGTLLPPTLTPPDLGPVLLFRFSSRVLHLSSRWPLILGKLHRRRGKKCGAAPPPRRPPRPAAGSLSLGLRNCCSRACKDAPAPCPPAPPRRPVNEAGPGRAASGCGDPPEPLGDRPWVGAGRGRGGCVCGGGWYSFSLGRCC